MPLANILQFISSSGQPWKRIFKEYLWLLEMRAASPDLPKGAEPSPDIISTASKEPRKRLPSIFVLTTVRTKAENTVVIV